MLIAYNIYVVYNLFQLLKGRAKPLRKQDSISKSVKLKDGITLTTKLLSKEEMLQIGDDRFYCGSNTCELQQKKIIQGWYYNILKV